jgi:hypothetical protein
MIEKLSKDMIETVMQPIITLFKAKGIPSILRNLFLKASFASSTQVLMCEPARNWLTQSLINFQANDSVTQMFI